MLAKNLKRLPDSFKKTEDSNNNKMLLLTELAVEDVSIDLQALMDCLDLNKAFGKTLDLYGEMLGQKRGQMTDEQYRYLIYTKVGSNSCTGDFASIIKNVATMLQADPLEINIQETDKSCELRIVNVPMGALISAGFTADQAIKMIQSILPVGTSIVDANFGGSFEFSASADEYDEKAGFGDVSQTIGGYFGMFVGNEADIPL